MFNHVTIVLGLKLRCDMPLHMRFQNQLGQTKVVFDYQGKKALCYIFNSKTKNAIEGIFHMRKLRVATQLRF
jgi:hypothetical protein